MSYDLKIYTVKLQDYNELLGKFNILINNDGLILPLKKSQIFVSNEMGVDDEDIPAQISRQLPGIQYLIECNLEPFTDNKKSISELLKLAKQIAQNGHGVIENPQTDEIILPPGIKRVMKIEKTERFSVVELSWWFNNTTLMDRENQNTLLREIERTVPEALPRRYGLYEPPTERFTGMDEFSSYLGGNINEGIVWYPTKPVVDVHLKVPPEIGPTKTDSYRFGYFSVEIDSAVLSMPGWRISINRLFQNISQILNPFYGDIHIFKNLIRSRNGAWIDNKTEDHPIVSWWWNGFPRKSGLGLVIGNPLLDYVKINRDCLILNNGGRLFIKAENDDKEIYDGIEIPDGIYQPEVEERPDIKVYGFSGLYPKIWPFEVRRE